MSTLESHALTAAELGDFYEIGFTRVFSHPLLSAGSALPGAVMNAYGGLVKELAFPGPTHLDMERKLDAGMPWFQSTFTVIPELWELASHPAVLGKVTAILGPDVLLWAASVLTKKPGEVHCWHTDTANWEGVSVFVGLQGTRRGSVVKTMSHSHRLGVGPYDLFTSGEWTDIRGESPLTSDEKVLAAARERDGRCAISAPDICDGDFFLFDGLTWHGSRNETAAPRTAATFFFARPDADVRIPTSFGKTPTWYREKPAAILAAGVDRFHKNQLVAPPRRA